jgi:hypothetical protein
VALGAFHYFRGVVTARVTRTLRLPCFEIKRVCGIFLQVCREMEIFLPYRSFSLTGCSSRVRGALRAFEMPLRTRSRSSLVSLRAYRGGRPRCGSPLQNVTFVATWRDHGSSFGMHSGQRSFDQDAGGGSVRVIPRFVPICPEVPFAPAAAIVDNPRSCCDLVAGVCLASPRDLSDRTSLTRFRGANAAANFCWLRIQYWNYDRF